MNTGTKIVLGIAGTSLVLWAVSAAAKTAKTVETLKDLEVALKPRIHKITFSKVTIAIDTTIINSNNKPVEIKFPVIRLYSGQNPNPIISNPEDRFLSIPASQKAAPFTVYIDLDVLKLAGVGTEVFKMIQTGSGVLKFKALVSTYVKVAGMEKQISIPKDIEIKL